MRKLITLRLWPIALLVVLIAIALHLFSRNERAAENMPRAKPLVPVPSARPNESADSAADDGHVIILSHVSMPGTIKDDCARVLQRRVLELSHGSWRVEISPNSEAFRDGDELGGLLAGGADMLVVSLAKLAELGDRDFEVYALPYLFRDDAEFRKVADGPVGKELLARLESKGATGLAYWSHGFQGISARRPIRRASDLGGMSVRVQHSRSMRASLEQVGAHPRVSTFAGQLELLKAGAVDGAENTPANFVSLELDTLQPYFTVSNHVLLAYAVVVRSAWWTNLPDESREMLQAALADATRESQRLTQSAGEAALALIQARGHTQIYYPTKAELEDWRLALEPVYEKAVWISPATLDAVKRTLGRSAR